MFALRWCAIKWCTLRLRCALRSRCALRWRALRFPFRAICISPGKESAAQWVADQVDQGSGPNALGKK